MRVGVRDTELEPGCVATIRLDLKRVVVGSTAPRVDLNVTIASVRTQEVVVFRAAGSEWIAILRMTRNASRKNAAVHESRRIGNSIDVALLAQMPRKGSHIARFHHRLETNILLHSKREVIKSDCLRVDFKTSKRCVKN